MKTNSSMNCSSSRGRTFDWGRAGRLLVATVGMLSVAVTLRAGMTDLPRYVSLRRIIQKSEYLNLHCWCQAINPTEIREKAGSLSDADIPVLLALLGDKNANIREGGQVLFEVLGEPALMALREKGMTAGEPTAKVACDSIRAIETEANNRKKGSGRLELDFLPTVGARIPDAKPCSVYSFNEDFKAKRFHYSVTYQQIEFGVVASERIERVSTSDKRFETPEGIRVGSTLDFVRQHGGSDVVRVKTWAFQSELPSGWHAAFNVGTPPLEALPGDAKVQWFFQFADPPEKWVQ